MIVAQFFHQKIALGGIDHSAPATALAVASAGTNR